MKIFSFFIASFFMHIFSVEAQDFIVKNNDEVIRGTIKGTDYFSVFISENDQTDVILPAKDVKNFFWNGNSYLSKGFASKKNLEYRFVKLMEMGAVNLYSFGGGTLMPSVKQKNVRFRPSFGIGTGTGGYGGMGVGGGISIGGGRGNMPDRPTGTSFVRYFIEKPGSGPLQEILTKAIPDGDKNIAIRSVLLQKLGDLPSVRSQIESADEFDIRAVINFIKTYNDGKKN